MVLFYIREKGSGWKSRAGSPPWRIVDNHLFFQPW